MHLVYWYFISNLDYYITENSSVINTPRRFNLKSCRPLVLKKRKKCETYITPIINIYFNWVDVSCCYMIHFFRILYNYTTLGNEFNIFVNKELNRYRFAWSTSFFFYCSRNDYLCKWIQGEFVGSIKLIF